MDRGELIQKFAVEGNAASFCEYGNGHINRTYLAEIEQGGKREKFIFQKINTDIFRNVDQLMENIMGVTSFLGRKIAEQGGDPNRETLQVIPTREGASYYRDEEGCYRMYRFITGAVRLDAVRKPGDFYESAAAFGNFQALLADYPAETLHETIPDFHNTAKRYAAFSQAVEEDVCGRVKLVGPEIEFLRKRERELSVLVDLLEAGELPLRVTHNDTKLNNIMMDAKTGKGICVIDLDTVMPGLAVHDFGDSIRFGASTGDEDEPDLSKVNCDLHLFQLYTEGFLKGCQGSLTETERAMLPMGAKVMTYECGMRFLTDYLQGDTYFKTHRVGQNLDRCRTQIKLVEDMEANWEKMAEIVAQC